MRLRVPSATFTEFEKLIAYFSVGGIVAVNMKNALRNLVPRQFTIDGALVSITTQIRHRLLSG